LAAAFAVAGLLPLTAALAEPPDPPPYYAIRDVRVMTGTGATLDGATVLIADGLIEAVGRDLAIPGDAWVIDGTGLTLYPGLIDGLGTLGQKQEESEGGGGGGGGGGPFGRQSGPEIRGPEDRPKTTPWMSAADEQGEDGRIEKWRKAGFTAAVTAPTEGIFSGQAAVIALGDSEPRERVLATPVAQRVSFDRSGFRAFPGSLMGVLSYFKQTLMDARYYAESRAIYAASPAGRERPAYDRALAPIDEALATGLPFLMPGDLAREIDRVLALGADYQFKTVLYGGQGAYARVAELKKAGIPVLVDLEWPEEEKDRDPDADTPYRTLYHRRMAPTTPAALAAGGVPFAFASGGISSPSELFASLRKAIDAGLSDADALRALTTAPAAIFGVSDRLGTIEKGKIANLVLASDAPWAEGVEIAAVFVDGRRFAELKDEEPKEAPASDVSGTWKLTLESPRGSRDMTAELKMAEDGKVTGELTSPRGNRPLEEGRMSGDTLRFKTTQSMGGRSMEASYSLTIEGEKVSGSMSAGPMTMDLSGERTAQAAAEGKADGDGKGDAPTVTLAELAEGMQLYQGPVRDLDSFAITNATVYTVSGETIPNGTVVVAGGKIAAVGADVAIPAGAVVFDAAGGSVIPGIIDAHSHIAGEGGINEGTLAVTAMVGFEDIINPDDISIYRALAGGVTTINALHGSANPIGGKNAVLKMRWGKTAHEMIFAGAPPGIKFALGENPKRSNFRLPGTPQRYPNTRMGVMDIIRASFVEARAYQQSWADYEAAKKAGAQKAGAGPIPPRRDLKLEALAEVLSGKRLVHSHCYRADEILQLLRLCEEFGVQVATLQHVLEGYKVADEIAAHGAGASTFSDWWGYKVEAYDAIPYNAALMTERGVLVSINSDSEEEMRHLNQEAAKAMKWGGLDEIEALKLVTLNPAKQLRIDDRVGSIEVGKDADLVVYDGNPLSDLSAVQQTFVDGELYFDRTTDRQRQARVDEIKARLLGKSDKSTEESTEEPSAEPEGGRSSTRRQIIWQDETYSCREAQ
jgi:imidazolonepropionase-like amidohydrolase